MEDDECLAEFRARKRDISLLEEALQIPEEFMMETEPNTQNNNWRHGRVGQAC